MWIAVSQLVDIVEGLLWGLVIGGVVWFFLTRRPTGPMDRYLYGFTSGSLLFVVFSAGFWSWPPYEDPRVSGPLLFFVPLQMLVATAALLAYRRRRRTQGEPRAKTPVNWFHYGVAAMFFAFSTWLVAALAARLSLAEYKSEMGVTSTFALVFAWAVFKGGVMSFAFFSTKRMARSLAKSFQDDWLFLEGSPRRRLGLLFVGALPIFIAALPVYGVPIEGASRAHLLTTGVAPGLVAGLLTLIAAYWIGGDDPDGEEADFLSIGALGIARALGKRVAARAGATIANAAARLH
jgi:hypothetical protein